MNPNATFRLADREPDGPFTLGQLRALWKAGALTVADRYWQDGQEELASFADLAGLLESPEPAPNAPAPRGGSAAPHWLAVGLLAVLTGAVLTHLYGRPAPLPKWEYSIVAPRDETLKAEMNQLGAEGWEIVGARRATGSPTDKAAYEFILKRPKRAE